MLTTINPMNVLDLVERIRSDRQDREAQEVLYRLVRRVLLERLRSKIPLRLQSRIDAEDVVDLAFLRALAALERFEAEDERSFYAWVYRIAKNVITDTARRHSVDVQHFATGEDERGPRASAILSKQRRAESIFQKRDWIETALSRLKEKEAEVIRLHWLEGCSMEDIASSWHKTPGAVRRFYSRSWERFRALAKAGE
jgi:RNA polymerase sigma factor (sigma-70 family)